MEPQITIVATPVKALLYVSRVVKLHQIVMVIRNYK
jgi:hypothetical protein